jgi:uncharacterized RDD family membrane protein YckC
MVNVLLIMAAFVIADQVGSYVARDCRGKGCVGAGFVESVIALCCTLLPLLILQVSLIALRGYTLGMRVAGLKVFGMNGTPAGFRKGVFLRYLPLIVLIGTPLLIVVLVDTIFAIEMFRDRLFDKGDLTPWLIGVPTVVLPLYVLADNLASLAGDGRSLHDRFAGTVVTLADKRAGASGAESNGSGSTSTRD